MKRQQEGTENYDISKTCKESVRRGMGTDELTE